MVLAGAVQAAPPRALFASDETLAVTLRAPWSRLRQGGETAGREPAVLAYIDADGREHRIAATVEPRGITRRRICSFPPLRLRIAKGEGRGSAFEGQRALKLVTHCEDGARWSQYYVLELLAYRIHNRLTRHSFRVRPLAVTYVDARGGPVEGPRFAFLIEDVDDMARRNGHRRLRTGAFGPGDYDALAMSRFMLFQFLIGNTDWEVQGAEGDTECCHNVRVTAAVEGASPQLVPVPYDLDSAGLVDAPYAGPDRRLPIRAVTERVFRGFCVHDHALQTARAELLAQRKAVLELVRGEPRLDARRRKAALDFLESGFAALAGERSFAREVRARCRS